MALNTYLQNRVREAKKEIAPRIDPPSHPSDSVALILASTIASAAIDAANPGIGFLFGTALNFIGEPRPSSKIVEPDIKRAVYQDFFRRRPIQPYTPKASDVKEWDKFLKSHWQALEGHGHIPVPPELCRPEEVGFMPTRLAAFVGQDEDWVLPLPDRSRLHIHGFHGRLEVHRDRLDPARGPIAAVWHWFTETPEGQLTSGALATLALAGWVARD